MNTTPFLPYGKQSINEDDIAAVNSALKGDRITRGPKVEEFEEAVAKYCGADYAVAFSSGTAALMAATYVAEIGAFDKVITSPNSFIATIGPSMQRKATPVFVDIDLETGNLNLEQVKHTIEAPLSRGKHVVIPVHFAGIAVDLEMLESLLIHPGSLIIEDAAHALGSFYPDGQKVGCCSYSAMTVFSFHPVKNMTTGEGGMVTTNEEDLFHRLKRFRDNGIERDWQSPCYYEVKELTGNYHLTEFQAALGISQLRRLDQMAAKRRSLVAAYRKKLEGVEGLNLFSASADADTAYHLFVAQVDFERRKTTREEVMRRLQEKGIGSQVHYIPLYRHPIFGKDLTGYFPNMERYYSQALSLPLFYDMQMDDVERVVKELRLAIG